MLQFDQMNLYNELQNKAGTQQFLNNKRLKYARLALHETKNARWQTNLHTGDVDFSKVLAIGWLNIP